MNNPLKPHEAVILSKKRETEDTLTYTFTFKDEDVKNNFHYAPGQFNMVGFWGGGEAAISFSSLPNGDSTFQHTFRVVGSVTGNMEHREVGDTLWIRGPFGRGWPLDEAMHKDVLIIGGGLGFAPLRPAIEYVLTHRNEFGNLFILYGAKSPREMMYREQFDRWKSSPNTNLLLTVDRTDGQQWEGNVGVVPTLLNAIKFFPEDTIAFVCGPEVMMKFTVLDLEKGGLPPSQIFVSMERKMQCGVAQCGHCFLGPKFVCQDGPVFRHTELLGLLTEGV